MNITSLPRTALIVSALLAALLLCGCSQDDSTSPMTPTDQEAFTVDDPLDDVLKSTDGETPSDPEDRLARLAEVLELDADQLAAFTLVYTEFHDAVDALRAQVQAEEITIEEAREAVALLREAFEAELMVILTEDQWNLLQEMRQNRPGHGGPHHPRLTPLERWTEWLTVIDADVDQTAAILEALDIRVVGIQALRDQLQEGTMTIEEMREAAILLRADFHAIVQSTLTEDQLQALRDLRPDCHGHHNSRP